MSHFFTIVIVPGDTEDINKKVEELLTPFDENTEVEPYKKYLDEDDTKRMAQYYKISNLSELAQKMDDWNGCEGGVDEQGLYRLSTYNPQSKWDWWSYGGRWNGEARGTYQGDGTGYNFGPEYRQLEDNIIPASRVYHRLTPFAIVTPDGKWHEKGEIGMASNEKEPDEWDLEVIKIIQGHNKDILVGVDCHI